MSGIRNYEVTVPPTSDEVAVFALEAIRKRAALEITARPEPSDIGPHEESVDISFSIKLGRFSEDESMRFIGETENGDTVNLMISADPEEPATFSMPFSH